MAVLTAVLGLLTWVPPPFLVTRSHREVLHRFTPPRMDSRFRIRARLRSIFKQQKRDFAERDAVPEVLPIPTVLAMADVSSPVSTCFTQAIADLASDNASTTFLSFADSSIATRVTPRGDWSVFTTGRDGALVTCSCLQSSSDDPESDVRITYRDEETFVALMDETLGSAAAVATGRLRVSGSLKLASASEELYVAAEALLRQQYGSAVVSAEEVLALQRAEEEELAAQLERRLAIAAERSPWRRWQARHVGTDQQIGAALLVFGSIAYSGYCALALECGDPADTLANELYLASSLLWLVGSVALIHSSYPERVVAIATTAEADARDLRRIAAMSAWERYVGASSLLLGAWALGVGSPTFLAGAVVQTLGHPTDPIAYAYDFAGVYLFVATGLLVLGSLPESLAESDGSGSTHLQGFLGGGRFWSVHAANDLLAGTNFFALFMVGCLAFGVIDFVLEPSKLTLCFMLSQVPFATGAALLARSTYPEGLNRASVWGESLDDEVVMDELRLRGLMPRGG